MYKNDVIPSAHQSVNILHSSSDEEEKIEVTTIDHFPVDHVVQCVVRWNPCYRSSRYSFLNFGSLFREITLSIKYLAVVKHAWLCERVFLFHSINNRWQICCIIVFSGLKFKYYSLYCIKKLCKMSEMFTTAQIRSFFERLTRRISMGGKLLNLSFFSHTLFQ